jgi:Tfp pilus assembly protein PilV
VPVRWRRGESLIELIVALVILELIGATALAGALAVERLDRHAARGTADDAARWQSYRARETLPSCTGAPAPDTIALFFPATPDRPGLATVLRCGR